MEAIDYKKLRKISPETARTAVLDYLYSCKGNISKTARVFGIQRLTVYDIIKRGKIESLRDQSRTPKTVVNKTALMIENKILAVKKRTGFGAKKLVKYLAKKYQLIIPLGTLRGILRRNL